jgi:hypothetical protein
MVTPFLVSGCFPLEPNRGSPPARLLASPLFAVGSICFRYARRWLRQVAPSLAVLTAAKKRIEGECNAFDGILQGLGRHFG